MLKRALFVAVSLAMPQAYASDLTNEDLRKSCAEKTIVMGRDENKKLVRAGEKLGGFCSGYLQASYSAYTNGRECKKDVSPEFLLSVYEQYIKDKKIPNSASATDTLKHAVGRIAECK